MNNKINILHIVSVISFGGAEYGVVINMLNKLDPQKYNCHLISIRTVNPLVMDKVKSHIRVDCFNKEQGIIRTIFKIRKYAKDNNINIIHTHNWSTYLFGFLCKKDKRYSGFFHTEHGRDTERMDIPLRRYFLQKVMYFFTTKLIAVSQDIADLLPSKWGINTKKITCIRNGVDRNIFFKNNKSRKSIRSELNISDDKVVIGTVSVLRSVKNHQLLISSFFNLLKIQSKLLLIIVGDFPDGNKRKELLDLVENLKIEKSVIFLGERSDISSLMNAFDIYVNMSLFEGTSITILEALATGLPVIASDVGGNPELVKDGMNGFLFESNNPNDLTDKLKILIEDQGMRENFSDEAVKFIEDNYSLDRMCLDYEKLYSGE